MRAVTWHGKRDVQVDTVPDPTIREATDAIVRVTSSGLCGSDLHLYEVMTPYMETGDILGHEPMGIVEAVGAEVHDLAVGDRVVIPFNIACGSCFMCGEGLHSQCETTQVTEYGSGAALFGYSKMYGQVAGGQAELLRVPQAHFGPIKVPAGPPDDRFLYLSDVLPTAWQAVEYADVGPGQVLVVLGLGPIGDMACRIALHRGVERVIGIDLVPERLARAAARGVETIHLDHQPDVAAAIRDRTSGRGADAVIDAVGMEAHGSPTAQAMQTAAGLLPDPLQRKLMETAGVDRLAALRTAIEVVRRGGTISIVGVYGGAADPLPMLTIFDKQIQIRMGQATLAARVDALVERLELGPIANRKAKGFSQGERTKIALARALVHDPQHLLLDEPTSGLDVMATRHLRDWLRELRSQGRCVLLSSHVMQEVEALVDELVIIAAGRVTLRGSPAELAQRFPGRSLEEIFVEAVRGAERPAA